MDASGQIRLRIKDWRRILVVAVKQRLHRPKTEAALQHQGKPGRTCEVTAAQNDLMTRMASGEIDTEAKKNKLIEAYIDELSRKLPEWENL